MNARQKRDAAHVNPSLRFAYIYTPPNTYLAVRIQSQSISDRSIVSPLYLSQSMTGHGTRKPGNLNKQVTSHLWLDPDSKAVRDDDSQSNNQEVVLFCRSPLWYRARSRSVAAGEA